MRDLTELRKELDTIDPQIVALFEQRLRISEEVAHYKIAQGLEVMDPAREQEKLASVRALASTPFAADVAEELFRQLMSISRRRQYQILEEVSDNDSAVDFHLVDTLPTEGARVLYQGQEGSYSQLATRCFFGDALKPEPVATWREAVSAVAGGEATYAVLPIENSTAGTVQVIYHYLLEYRVYIAGEIVLPVEHALLTLPDATPDDIRTVYSHPQALAQCAAYLAAHPAWRTVEMANTAFAAAHVAGKGDRSAAAIASVEAADHFGLSVLSRDLSPENNQTRFIVIEGEPVFCRDASKVSICFGLPHACGTLCNLLAHFLFNGLNLTKIESAPVPERPFEYRFFLDFEGNLADAAVRNALRGIRAEAGEFTLLGNYSTVFDKGGPEVYNENDFLQGGDEA